MSRDLFWRLAGNPDSCLIRQVLSLWKPKLIHGCLSWKWESPKHGQTPSNRAPIFLWFLWIWQCPTLKRTPANVFFRAALNRHSRLHPEQNPRIFNDIYGFVWKNRLPPEIWGLYKFYIIVSSHKNPFRGSTNRAAEKPIAFRSPVHLPLLVFDRKTHRKPQIYPKYRVSPAHLPD